MTKYSCTCVKLLNTVEFGGAEEFHFQCTEYDKEVFFSNLGASIRDFRYAVKVGISGVVNSV